MNKMSAIDFKSIQYSTCVNKGLGFLLANAYKADVTLAADGNFIKAHQIVLAMFSPYFEELFKANPCSHPIFFVKNVSYEVLKALLTFIYEGKVTISNDKLQEFVDTAELLKITGYRDMSMSVYTDSEINDLDHPLPGTSNTMNEIDSENQVKVEITEEGSINPEIDTFNGDSNVPNMEIDNALDLHGGTSNTMNEIDSEHPLKAEITEQGSINPEIDTFNGDLNVPNMEIDNALPGNEQIEDDNNCNESDDDIADDSTNTLNDATNTPIPQTRKYKVYEYLYSNFCQWRATYQITTVTENVFYRYILHKSRFLTGTTLHTQYSILKTMLKLKERINVTKFKIFSRKFLCKTTRGYKPRKVKYFTNLQSLQFLQEAPNKDYLLIKIALIVGTLTKCSMQHMNAMELNDLKMYDDHLVLSVPQNKSPYNVVIENKVVDGVNKFDLISQYLALRPTHTPHDRLFVKYKSGSCTIVPVGVDTFQEMPLQIAAYLKLDEPYLHSSEHFHRLKKS